MEKKTNREEIYEGKVIHVVKDSVELDDGSRALREVVLHNGGVCIGLNRDGRYAMVRQYRYAQGKMMYEFPAGKIEKGEDPDEAILRESVEETGYEAIDVIKLGQMIPTCGYSSEIIYLYHGRAGKECGQHLDVDERIDVSWHTLDEIRDMVKKGLIDDGKTMALLYRMELENIDE